FTVRYVLGNVDCGPAILATQSQSLQHADDNESDRRKYASFRISRHQADKESAATHEDERNQKCIFASHQVADSSKEKRSKGTHDKANRKSGQIRDVGECVISRREEFQGQNCCKTSKDIEVVPLDHGSYG